MRKNADLAERVNAFCTLIHADAICVWKIETEKIAIPLACYPSGWLEVPFVMPPMTDDMMFHVTTADILPQLPLVVRARSTDHPPGALLKIKNTMENGVSVGIIAIWNDPQKIVAELEIINQLTRLTLERLFRFEHLLYQNNEANQQMRAFADVLPHGVIIVPMDTQTGYVNHVAAQLLGFNKNEVSSMCSGIVNLAT